MKTSSLFLISFVTGVAQAYSATWTRCTNAPRCEFTTAPGGGEDSDASFSPDAGSYYPGGYLFPYQTTSGFRYSESDGYWYSHDVDGEYISPAGYMKFAHGYNNIGIDSKNQAIGTTYWSGINNPCCLPDQVGTNIYDVISYDIGSVKRDEESV